MVTGINDFTSISCPVSGYQPPFVTWEKNGTQLQKGENNMPTTGSVEEEDFGVYTCTATNCLTPLGPSSITVINNIQ